MYWRGNREKLKGLIKNESQNMIAESIERELKTTETELLLFKEKIAGIGRASYRRVSCRYPE
jgi:hypothetical protein